MLVNYLKIALRIIQKSKVFFVINLLGLTLGMTTAILIMLYVNYEFNYDKFHNDYNRIYRVCVKGKIANDKVNVALSNVSLADYLNTNYDEIEAISRVEHADNISFIKNRAQEIFVKNIICADTSFFNIFKCEWIEGNPNNALQEKNTIVITKSLADEIFPNSSALGNKIMLNNKHEVRIIGIIKDYSKQSHINFEAVLPMSFYLDGIRGALPNWGSLDIMTYVKLKKNINTLSFEAKIKNIINENLELKIKESGVEFFIYLQAITSIHLYSNLLGEFANNTDDNISYVYILSAVAVFILLIACINFMNLSTARAGKRAREVAMRKINGANRWDLVKQFMGETIFLSLISLLLSLGIIEIILPYFNQFVERELSMEMVFKTKFIINILFLTILVGIISGSYPALYLSSFSPIKVLKNNLFKYGRKTIFRNMLVLFQFTISIVLIICTLIIFQQMTFVNNQKLGFDKDNILVVPIKSNNEHLDLDYFKYVKKSLMQLPEIESVGCSKGITGDDYDGSGLIPEGQNNNNPWLIFNTSIDDNYIPTMNMKILKGRNFQYSISDSNAVIINQTLQKKLGWDEPIGKLFNNGLSTKLHVVGVVEDFNFRSLHDSLQPFLFFYNPHGANVLNIRIEKKNYTNTIEIIKEHWLEIMPDIPFDYYYLDKTIENKYLFEKKMSSMFFVFSFISIFIASLGLFGLASFAVEQRKKEIGIRKILGANVLSVTKMLIFDLTKWVIVANILAYPIAYFAMESWLDNFAYRTNIDINNFLYATIIAFAIAIITVSIKVVKTAYDNPINSIKYE